MESKVGRRSEITYPQGWSNRRLWMLTHWQNETRSPSPMFHQTKRCQRVSRLPPSRSDLRFSVRLRDRATQCRNYPMSVWLHLMNQQKKDATIMVRSATDQFTLAARSPPTRYTAKQQCGLHQGANARREATSQPACSRTRLRQ